MLPSAQAYIGNYTGHTKIDRLLFVAERGKGTPLELEALKIAHDELKKACAWAAWACSGRQLQRVAPVCSSQGFCRMAAVPMLSSSSWCRVQGCCCTTSVMLQQWCTELHSQHDHLVV